MPCPHARRILAPEILDPQEHGSLPASIPEWVAAIQQAWDLGASNTLGLARLMSSARQNLRAHGHWSRLWRNGLKSLPFSKRKADMLVAIGDELGNLNEQVFAHLPRAWSILYLLSRLGRTTVESLVNSGTITPNLGFEEARELLDRFGGHSRHKRRSSLTTRVARFAAYVEKESTNWSLEEKRYVVEALADLMALLSQAPMEQNSRHQISPSKLAPIGNVNI